jgi:hypothetical protein
MHKITTIQQKGEKWYYVKSYTLSIWNVCFNFKKILKAEGNLLELNENA